MGQFIGFVLSSLLRAVVISCLWGWFLHPLGVPHLQNIWHAFGVSAFIGLFTIDYIDGPADAAARKNHTEEQSKARIVLLITSSFLYHGLVLGIGWLFKLGVQ